MAQRYLIIAALLLGARGVLLKEATPDLLFRSIRTVFEGGYWLGEEAIVDLLEAARSFGSQSPRIARERPFNLTAREREVTRHVVAGQSNKTMAQRFGVTEDTVKHHLTSIFDKVGVSSRLELALFAMHHDLA